MKYRCSIFLSFIFFLSAFSQNWSVINSASDSLHFDGSGTLLSLIPDSVYQSSTFKAIYPQKEIEFYDTIQSGCDGTPYGASWCGSVIYEEGGVTYFVFGLDSLVVSRLDSSIWCTVKNESINVVRINKQWDTSNTLSPDSVWVFQLLSSGNSNMVTCLNGQELIISKNHGLVSFPACFNEYRRFSQSTYSQKYRVGSAHQISFQPHTVIDFFDYDIGDELHYRKFTNGNTSNHSSLRKWVSVVTAKSIGTLGITYSYRDTGYHSNPISGTQWFSRKYSRTHRFDKFDFKHSGSVYKLPASNEARMVFNIGIGQEIHVIGDMLNIIDSCADEYAYYQVWKSLKTKYVKGVGLWEEHEDVYLGFPSYTNLEYYSIKGNVYGNPHAFGTIEYSLPKLIVYPNPAHSFVEIEGISEKGAQRVDLADLSGRVVLSLEISSGDNRIDLSTLSKGAYILRMEGYAPIKLIKY